MQGTSMITKDMEGMDFKGAKDMVLSMLGKAFRSEKVKEYRKQLMEALNEEVGEDELVDEKYLEELAEKEQEEEQEDKIALLKMMQLEEDDEDGEEEHVEDNEEGDEAGPVPDPFQEEEVNEEEFDEEDIKALTEMGSFKDNLLEKIQALGGGLTIEDSAFEAKIEANDGQEVEEVYGLSQVIIDFDSRMGDKTDKELFKIIKTSVSIEEQLLAIYGVYQKVQKFKRLLNVHKHKSKPSFYLEVAKAEVFGQIGEILNQRDDFAPIIVKLIRPVVNYLSILSRTDKKAVKLIKQLLTTDIVDGLVKQFDSFDTTLAIFSIDALSKILITIFNEEGGDVVTQPGTPELSETFKSVYDHIFNIVTQGRDKALELEVIKYKTANEILVGVNQEEWMDLAPGWLLWTCKAMSVGSAIQFRNAEFEEYLKQNQGELIQVLGFDDKEAQLEQLIQAIEGAPGTVFFVLHIFDKTQGQLFDLGLRKAAQNDAKNMDGVALDYVVADFDWVSKNFSTLQKTIKDKVKTDISNLEDDFEQSYPEAFNKVQQYKKLAGL